MPVLLKTFREPTEKRYEDRYGQYLSFFKHIAESPPDCLVEVRNPPWCWVPLLRYLNCNIIDPIRRFPHCALVKRMLWLARKAVTGEITTNIIDRTAVEVLCGFRPELVDALYKIDTQWNVPPGRTMQVTENNEFIVTNNGSFHRLEVLAYIQELKAYVPTKRKVVLVPCAADKPYPAPLHQAVFDILPKDYYVAIATGVLGIVPEDMWPTMPLYDSGIPNQWRLFELAKEYFYRNQHLRVVVYCDFYAHVLESAFDWVIQSYSTSLHFVLPPVKYESYVDLMSAENLGLLKQALEED